LIRYLLYIFFFLILILHRPISTLFPYTTLFRSYQFVMRYRIEESKRLLLSRPDLNITNIAELSGFSSLSVFGRAFTQKMNCSPRSESTRLNSSHVKISYAVFCLKKKTALTGITR